jgi:hypothetical protein
MTFSPKVTAQTFGDAPDVLVMITVVAIIGLVLLMVIAGEVREERLGLSFRVTP